MDPKHGMESWLGTWVNCSCAGGVLSWLMA